MFKTLLLIVNPKAGKRRSRSFFFDVFQVFSQAGYLIRLRLTAGPGDATRIAREEGGHFDLVVCYGGDGALNQVSNGLLRLDSPPPVGYIAGGRTKDFAAGLSNFFGGRSGTYEDELMRARTQALAELEQRAAQLGADAVVGIDVDYEVLGSDNGMLMVTVSGTAVSLN